MSVQELEETVTRLSETELVTFAKWFDEYMADQWDRRFAEDVQSGRLDAAGRQADEHFEAGRCTPLPCIGQRAGRRVIVVLNRSSRRIRFNSHMTSIRSEFERHQSCQQPHPAGRFKLLPLARSPRRNREKKNSRNTTHRNSRKRSWNTSMKRNAEHLPTFVERVWFQPQNRRPSDDESASTILDRGRSQWSRKDDTDSTSANFRSPRRFNLDERGRQDARRTLETWLSRIC